ncbi:MAG: hypothetical protein ABIA12_02775 [Candidatus Aenigmatarchaeota archaeon]
MEEGAGKEPKLPGWRFESIMDMLRVLYDCGETKVGDYYAVGFMFASDLMRAVYCDMSPVYSDEFGDDILYSGLLHRDLKHLVEVGVLRATKVVEDCGPYGMKEVDGYDITAEGLVHGYRLLGQLSAHQPENVPAM